MYVGTPDIIGVPISRGFSPGPTMQARKNGPRAVRHVLYAISPVGYDGTAIDEYLSHHEVRKPWERL